MKMKLLASLQNRMFLASAAVAVIGVGSAIHFVTQRVAREADAELLRGLDEAGTQVEHHFAARAETLALVAHLIADLPKLKAAAETGDPPTVQPLLADYRAQAHADLLAVTNRDGLALGYSGGAAREALPQAAVEAALRGQTVVTFPILTEGALDVVTVPIVIGAAPPEVLGTLSLGFALSDRLAAELKAVTQSEVAIAHKGRIVASTLPRAHSNLLTPLLAGKGPAAGARADIATVALDQNEYVATRRPLGAADAPTALVLRSRTEQLHFLRTFRNGLLLAAFVAVVLAVGLSYAVALTVTRPLRAISATMREMTATGDLARKILLTRRWDDEDAAMLAATFNTLTDAIARFQREAALRERLSVLGRLSTVIAHEVRNPLMIIKGALRTLRRWDTADATMQEALLDIDNEVARLNRIVGDILDFARPIRLELAREDLNALCRKATAAALRDAENLRVEFALDAALPPVLTDAERLRTVLVNVLANAREAVLAHRSAAQQAREGVGTSAAGATSSTRDTGTIGPDPDVELRTRQLPSGRVEVVVTDGGGGVDPALLPHIFEPYFTTKRTGTGLGLAIAKNIVDALGGTLSASRSLRGGTEIRLELAIEPALAADGVLAARVGARV